MAMTLKKSSLSFKVILFLKSLSCLVQLTFGVTHVFPLQVSNGSNYYFSTGSNDDNLGYTSEKFRGGKAISTTHNYNTNTNSLNYNPNKNSLSSLNGITMNNNIDTNDLDSLWSNTDDSLSQSVVSPGGGGGGDPASSSSSNVGYETTGLASTNYGQSYTIGQSHGHVHPPVHHHHQAQHGHRGWGWTPPVVPIKAVHHQHYPAVHAHYPKGPSHYVNHHHNHGWNNHGFGGGWNNGYIIGQSFGWNLHDFDIWDTVIGWLGLKGVGLASVLKSLLIIIPAAIIIIFLILLIPIPFFTQSCARTTSSLWSETSRLTQKVLNSDECVERMSCELSRMAKKYNQTTWIDTLLKNMPQKYQSTKWMKRISKSLTYNTDEVDTSQEQKKKGKDINKCSKFVCDPLTQLKKSLLPRKNTNTSFQENLEVQSHSLPEPILTTTTTEE